jgi:predicted permease
MSSFAGHALREFRIQPIVIIAAIVSLALGIGAAMTIFTLVNSVLLRPLPVANPEQLVTVSTASARRTQNTEVFSYATFDQIRRAGSSSAALAWSLSLLAVDGEPAPVSSMWVSGDFFATLGVRAIAGRTTSAADDVAGGGPDGPVAMISHRWWQRRFHGAADVIGRALLIERTPVTIVGVTPPEFSGVELGRSFDLFLPVRTQGILEAAMASRVLVGLVPAEDVPVALDLSFDWRVALFASGLALAAASFFGVVPAMQTTRLRAFDVLRTGRRDQAAGSRALNGFLAAQVAMALFVVVTAGLLLRTFEQLTDVSLGFDSERILLGSIDASRIPVADRRPVYERIVAAVAALPDVAGAGGAIGGPLAHFGTAGFSLSVSGSSTPADTHQGSRLVDVTPGWIAAHGIAQRDGRDIGARDTADALPVMLVNEAFVRRFFPGERLIDRPLALTVHTPDSGEVSLGTRTVIGIVRDTVYNSIREPAAPTIYQPLNQRAGPLYYQHFFLAVRPAAQSPAQIGERVRAVVTAAHPDLRATFRPMSERVNTALAQDRLTMRLSLFGGVFTLLLAAVGLYGVTAYGVTSRRSELGIRLALGSAPLGVVRLVVGQTARVVGVGLALGLSVSLWSGHYIASLLYGVSPRDPLVAIAACVTLVGVAIAAAGLPAYRASRVDPSLVLRQS